MASKQAGRRRRYSSNKLETRHLDVEVDLSHVEEQALRVVKAFFGVSNGFYSISRLEDGITNIVLLCRRTQTAASPHPDALVLRVYGQNTDVVIDRVEELQYHLQLYEFGLASKLYGTFSNGYVYGFFEGSPCTAEDLQSPTVWPLIARKLARFHQVPITSGSLTCFETIHNWIPALPAECPKAEHADAYRALMCPKRLATLAEQLRVRCMQYQSRFVFAHNDLLAGNVIVSPDKQDVHFIDFEYCAPNPAAYDVANHFNEYCGIGNYDIAQVPSFEQQTPFVKEYLTHVDGAEPTEERLASFQEEICAYLPVSHLFWGVWSFIQACNSTIDFDYAGYGIGRMKALDECLEQSITEV